MRGVKQRCSKGFVLLEVVLALMFFSIAATGFVTALHRTGEAALLATQETSLARIIDSALVEAISRSRIEAGENIVNLDEFGTRAQLTVTTVIEPLELENEDGNPLNNLFSIKVKVTWFDGAEWQEREGETWRNGRLYTQR